jgi:hypothetical protein
MTLIAYQWTLRLSGRGPIAGSLALPGETYVRLGVMRGHFAFSPSEPSALLDPPVRRAPAARSRSDCIC